MPPPPPALPTHGRPSIRLTAPESATPLCNWRWTVEFGLIALFIDLLWWIRR